MVAVLMPNDEHARLLSLRALCQRLAFSCPPRRRMVQHYAALRRFAEERFALNSVGD
jgi:predicted PP-loop superfamily ATPase